MNNKEPLVSVIMPTYKNDKSFQNAISSVLNQSYKNLELIIVDDNFDGNIKNNNEKLINSINDNRIRYIQNEKNIGSAASRNKAIWLAKGEYITFLDDDDLYLADKIKNQVFEMMKNDSDFSASNVLLYNSSDKVIDKRSRTYLYNKHKESLFVKHLKYHITCTDTLMFKTNFIKEINGFDNNDLGDEFFLMSKAFQKSPKFCHINKYDVKAFVHNDTGLSSYSNKISNEEVLYNYKLQFKDMLSKADLRYIRMRHFAVYAYAYKKAKQYLKCLNYVIKSFFACPNGFFTLFNGKGK